MNSFNKSKIFNNRVNKRCIHRLRNQTFQAIPITTYPYTSTLVYGYAVDICNGKASTLDSTNNARANGNSSGNSNSNLKTLPYHHTSTLIRESLKSFHHTSMILQNVFKKRKNYHHTSTLSCDQFKTIYGNIRVIFDCIRYFYHTSMITSPKVTPHLHHTSMMQWLDIFNLNYSKNKVG